METITGIIKKHQDAFQPVVPFDPVKDKLLKLDFTESNTTLSDTILQDTARFNVYIHDCLSAANARYGIGGYAEYRTVYRVSRLFDASGPDEEPRRLHLGLDIWGKPYTKVMAPMDGIVHSFAFNNSFGNYGVTVILSHVLENSCFYTLYGHLSLNSIKNMQEGDVMNAGDVFAEFGIPAENGHWPPHLHFQVIIDIGDYRGDYPGVCRYSEKEMYLRNSPDPDMIVQMNQYL